MMPAVGAFSAMVACCFLHFTVMHVRWLLSPEIHLFLAICCFLQYAVSCNMDNRAAAMCAYALA
jgi:hypothetical protein